MSLKEILETNEISSLGSTLYYPGAGKDIKFLLPLVERTSLERFIFADYEFDPEKVPDVLGSNCFLKHKEEIFPEYFGKTSWPEFWDDNPRSHSFMEPDHAKGERFQFIAKNGKSFEVIYIKTEGIGSLKVLVEYSILPDVIVIQDHGTGGNWYFFGVREGEPSIMYKFLQKNNILPSHIISESEGGLCNVWPGYSQISETFTAVGSMHSNSRAFFKLN